MATLCCSVASHSPEFPEGELITVSSNANKLLEEDALILELLFLQLVTLKVAWFSREIDSKKYQKGGASALSEV